MAFLIFIIQVTHLTDSAGAINTFSYRVVLLVSRSSSDWSRPFPSQRWSRLLKKRLCVLSEGSFTAAAAVVTISVFIYVSACLRGWILLRVTPAAEMSLAAKKYAPFYTKWCKVHRVKRRSEKLQNLPQCCLKIYDTNRFLISGCDKYIWAYLLPFTAESRCPLVRPFRMNGTLIGQSYEAWKLQTKALKGFAGVLGPRNLSHVHFAS